MLPKFVPFVNQSRIKEKVFASWAKRLEEKLVNLQVKNIGDVAGAEVVQLYVKDDQASFERPEKELKAFAKVFLNPGESKIVTLVLNEGAFSYYDDKKKEWVLEPGRFTLLVGSSSRDIKLTGEVTF